MPSGGPALHNQEQGPTNGGMGDECEKFLKNLAELLAKEDGEDDNDVMMCLRTMLSFYVLRAVVLCVRGLRRPWA